MTSFASFICNRFDPEYEYKSKTKALSRDTRINPSVRFNNYQKQYKELQEYEHSSTYRNVVRAKALIPDFEIEESALRSAMTKQYQLSNNEYLECLRQLANDREINVRRSTFEPSNIKISKR